MMSQSSNGTWSILDCVLGSSLDKSCQSWSVFLAEVSVGSHSGRSQIHS